MRTSFVFLAQQAKRNAGGNWIQYFLSLCGLCQADETDFDDILAAAKPVASEKEYKELEEELLMY